MRFWLNGEWRDAKAAISIDDRGFLLGDGAFETILIRNGAPAFLEAHLARLRTALSELAIKAALPADIGKVIRELAAQNGLSDKDASLRCTVTRGPGPRGLALPREGAATILMTVSPASHQTDKVCRLVISRRRRAMLGVGVRHKTLAYLDNILARNEAGAAGADDALMLNPAGRVACATAANVFAVLPDGIIATPPESDGALPGIVRGVLLARARNKGLIVEERVLARHDIEGATLVLTNSLIGVAPAQLEGQSAPPREMFNRLRSCYEEALAEDLQERARAS